MLKRDLIAALAPLADDAVIVVCGENGWYHIADVDTSDLTEGMIDLILPGDEDYKERSER